jgi:hypothetical protein
VISSEAARGENSGASSVRLRSSMNAIIAAVGNRREGDEAVHDGGGQADLPPRSEG